MNERKMNYIATHQPQHLLSIHNISIGNCDTVTSMSKTALSQKAVNVLLPDLKLLNSIDCAPDNAKKLSKSFADLEMLVREVQIRTTSGASRSMSKLDHPPIKTGSIHGLPPMKNQPLTHNAVFTIHVRGASKPTRAPRTRRTSQTMKIRSVVANRQRKRELKLDDMGRLRGMMEEYRKQKKSGKYNYNFDSDSDDEDLDV